MEGEKKPKKRGRKPKKATTVKKKPKNVQAFVV